ncbi:hypothetical protein CPter91_4666 [Collimonas pratensis]|uniref:Uncharacterized protein n=1 Tax=Collimonas pratensis TaxID=279113 RepID=A0A127QAT3_9BURK|nr:hypothetical protein CPter91_4666 [Collimonas pratensis]
MTGGISGDPDLDVEIKTSGSQRLGYIAAPVSSSRRKSPAPVEGQGAVNKKSN